MNDKKQKSSPIEKMFYNLTLLIFAAVIATVFIYEMVFCLFFKRTEQSAYDKDLAQMPEFTFGSFFSGDYTNNLSRYFTDTVHGRDEFKRNASKIKAYYGIQEDEEYFGDESSFPPEPVSEPASEPVSGEEPSETSSEYSDISSGSDASDISDTSDTSNTSEEPSEPVSEESSEPPVGQDQEIINNIVILGKGSNVRAMEIFYHTDAAAKTYAARVNAFAAKVPGVRVYSMVVPKQCAFYLKGSSKYGYLWDQSLKTDTLIKENLSGVTYVDAYHTLEKHISEEVYARTDHHWTALGAYYATEEFAKAAGVPYAPMSEYELNRRQGYVGTMYSYTKSAKLLNNPEDFITLVPKVEHKANFYNKKFGFITEHDIFWFIRDDMKSGWYSTFLGNDDYMVKVKSPVCTNGRKVLIIKDSYGNALTPLLLSSFEEIYVADLRYAEVNLLDFIDEHDITDVVFAICSYTAVSTKINSRIETLTTLGK